MTINRDELARRCQRKRYIGLDAETARGFREKVMAAMRDDR